MPGPGRRTLSFASLDQVMPEVDRLLAGYSRAGNWSLGQVCNHLARTALNSVEGFPGRVPWLVRRTIGRFAKRRVLGTGRMPDGVKLPGPALPKPDLDDRAEAEALRAALHLYAANTGPMAEHPFFGPLSRAEWSRLHCIHCAHHLGFLRPEGPG